MKIALVGNQNCGKTSLFNILTGSNQKIGNWPGVTVERKEGLLGESKDIIVDLPGTYSLVPYTSEEAITSNFLLNNNYDIIINVVDATNLERSLFLTTQLLELERPIIIALNMIDILEKKGLEINEKILSNELGEKVVKVSALKNIGIKELVNNIYKKPQKSKINLKIYSNIIENEIKCLKNKQKHTINKFEIIDKICNASCEKQNDKFEFCRARNIIENINKSDIYQIFAGERYWFIERLRDKCLIQKNKYVSKSEKIDKIILNKWLAIPIFMLIISGVYLFSVGVVGKISSNYLGGLLEKLKDFVVVLFNGWGVSIWLTSLVVDGIISGVGAVLVFLPQLIMLFLCISILECVGYMSRIAFMFDRIFRCLGLSGKSIIPFIVGSGCTVPAIMCSRTIENEQEKNRTIMLTPFVPCSAKLPIIALFAGAFFPNNSGLISISLYFFAIFVIVFCAFLTKKISKNFNSNFISELPEYKLPSVRYVLKDVFDKTKGFVVRAGSIILFSSVVIWFLSSFNLSMQYGVQVESSILAHIGKLFSWFFYPFLGEFNWAASVSAIQGLVAKEQVVSSLSVISGVSGGDMFSSCVLSNFNAASAYAYMVFNLFSAPCFGSIAAMKAEFKSTKKTIFVVLFQIIIAWVLSVLVFNLLRLFV